jgi:hypothetical protein
MEAGAGGCKVKIIGTFRHVSHVSNPDRKAPGHRRAPAIARDPVVEKRPTRASIYRACDNKNLGSLKIWTHKCC